MFVPDVSLLWRNVIKAAWRGFHSVTPSTAAPAPPESGSVRARPPGKGGQRGVGDVYLSWAPPWFPFHFRHHEQQACLTTVLSAAFASYRAQAQGGCTPA